MELVWGQNGRRETHEVSERGLERNEGLQIGSELGRHRVLPGHC